ncbi:hypothetical protein JL722_8314 [Aureococcus anophagefferens]|nr:hypothetical protein JL722_8314 [Aureococcus anophagefferens]
MIARPKISQNEWKTAEKAFEVGNFALLSCLSCAAATANAPASSPAVAAAGPASLASSSTKSAPPASPSQARNSRPSTQPDPSSSRLRADADLAPAQGPSKWSAAPSAARRSAADTRPRDDASRASKVTRGMASCSAAHHRWTCARRASSGRGGTSHAWASSTSTTPSRSPSRRSATTRAPKPPSARAAEVEAEHGGDDGGAVERAAVRRAGDARRERGEQVGAARAAAERRPRRRDDAVDVARLVRQRELRSSGNVILAFPGASPRATRSCRAAPRSGRMRLAAATSLSTGAPTPAHQISRADASQAPRRLAQSQAAATRASRASNSSPRASNACRSTRTAASTEDARPYCDAERDDERGISDKWQRYNEALICLMEDDYDGAEEILRPLTDEDDGEMAEDPDALYWMARVELKRAKDADDDAKARGRRAPSERAYAEKRRTMAMRSTNFAAAKSAQHKFKGLLARRGSAAQNVAPPGVEAAALWTALEAIEAHGCCDDYDETLRKIHLEQMILAMESGDTRTARTLAEAGDIDLEAETRLSNNESRRTMRQTISKRGTHMNVRQKSMISHARGLRAAVAGLDEDDAMADMGLGLDWAFDEKPDMLVRE